MCSLSCFIRYCAAYVFVLSSTSIFNSVSAKVNNNTVFILNVNDDDFDDISSPDNFIYAEERSPDDLIATKKSKSNKKRNLPNHSNPKKSQNSNRSDFDHERAIDEHGAIFDENDEELEPNSDNDEEVPQPELSNEEQFEIFKQQVEGKSFQVYICDNKQTELSLEDLNDNFCDCSDGSDEPGTSACAGTNIVPYSPVVDNDATRKLGLHNMNVILSQNKLGDKNKLLKVYDHEKREASTISVNEDTGLAELDADDEEDIKNAQKPKLVMTQEERSNSHK